MKRIAIFNERAVQWFCYEFLVGLVALMYLAGREVYATHPAEWVFDPMVWLRHFPIQELPTLAGALALAQVPHNFTNKKWRKWAPALLLTAFGSISLDMGVILRVAADQDGHLGSWQIWLGYGSAFVAFILAAISADISGIQEEKADMQPTVAETEAKA